MSEQRIVNPFPYRRGLWRVKAVPYVFKDRWPEAPFGDRWRRIKARLSAPVEPPTATEEMRRAGAAELPLFGGGS